MGFLGKLFAETGAGTVKGVLEGVGSLAKDIRTAITGDMSPEKKAELQEKMMELENMAREGQVQINIQEAKHPSVFVSGWRPFIGWVCGVSIGCYFIPQYLLAAILWVKISWAAQALAPFPVEANGLLELVSAMLGLAIIRGVEKSKGVARS